jgi:hypothetical protein
MKTPALLLVIACAAALALPPAPKAYAQEEEDLTAGLRTMRVAFDRARQRIDNLDFSGAVRELEAVIAPRRAAKPADLSDEELELLVAAYDLRARSLFSMANSKGAEADYETLLRLKPGYPIDRQTLSPKVVDLFDKVRARIAGRFVLDLNPPKARVLVDGEPTEMVEGGLTLLAGNHVLQVQADGYDPHEETVAIVAGAAGGKTIRLRPNKRTVQFITVPAGVTVRLDGAPAGTTQGPATPEVAALAAQFGFDPAAAAAPLLIPLLTPGDHKVTFEKECFQPQTLSLKVSLDVEANAPMRLAPVVLQEARSELRIGSTPPGAEVFIDGDKKGTTPLVVPGLCGGEREVLVTRSEIGTWDERIRIVPGQTNALDVRLRPTLLYAGTFRLDEWGRAVWSDEDKPFLDELGRGLKTLNLVRNPDVLKTTREAVIKWMINQPNEVRAGAILPPEIVGQAATTARADLVLAGLTTGDADHTWTLALYSVLHPAPDVTTLRTDRPDMARDFIRRLENVPAATAPWFGMSLVDTQYEPAAGVSARGGATGAGGLGGIGLGAELGGPLVVRVLPGSPAAKAGVRLGDRVRSVGERRTTSVKDVNAAFAAEMTRPGGLRATLVLAVDDLSGTRTARFSPEDGPVVLPLTDPTMLYNRALAEFRLRARAAQDDLERGVALLNLGVAFMHFRAHDRANSDGFARASLPQGTGISDGTVQYYRGLCALRRGDPGMARAALKTAAAATTSTLESNDGPSAASAAARLLKILD